MEAADLQGIGFRVQTSPPLAANHGSLLVLALKARHLVSPACKGWVREEANQLIILYRMSPEWAIYTPIGRACSNVSRKAFAFGAQRRKSRAEGPG